ncbi:unnamed protein product [Citrullus colocynthis]|uniref:Uncharacterized protein n=1 Tax=Citrullus colocynthis TaxID=252529 RepID=A0ABP0YM65_9ROSI
MEDMGTGQAAKSHNKKQNFGKNSIGMTLNWKISLGVTNLLRKMERDKNNLGDCVTWEQEMGQQFTFTVSSELWWLSTLVTVGEWRLYIKTAIWVPLICSHRRLGSECPVQTGNELCCFVCGSRCLEYTRNKKPFFLLVGFRSLNFNFPFNPKKV